MKLYCLVENNKVVSGPALLPPNLSDKSDFELLEMGWYVVEQSIPNSFNDRYEIWLPINFDIQMSKVICTYTKRNKTSQELEAQNRNKQLLVESDKQSRLNFANTFMESTEYQQLSEEQKLKWIEYVQLVETTITDGLADAIWDVWFPSHPPTVSI